MLLLWYGCNGCYIYCCGFCFDLLLSFQSCFSFKFHLLWFHLLWFHLLWFNLLCFQCYCTFCFRFHLLWLLLFFFSLLFNDCFGFNVVFLFVSGLICYGFICYGFICYDFLCYGFNVVFSFRFRYAHNTPKRLKIIDAYLVYVFLTGVMQVFSSFKFTSYKLKVSNYKLKVTS